jgi:hypothetical protein
MNSVARVAIAIPSHGATTPEFSVSLARVCEAAGTHRAQKYELVRIILVMDSLLPRGRERLVLEAIKANATHILWLDTDMRFPSHTLEALFYRRKDFVGANYVRRHGNPEFTAMRGNETLPTTEHSPPIERADVVGLGCALTHIGVFHKIEQPWFMFGTSPGPEHFWIGEDAWLCERARKADIPVWVDHELGREIGHVGSVVWTGDMAS